MVRKLTLRQAGGSVTVTLPKEITERLHLKAGDELFVVETDGGVVLTPYDPTFERAMELYREGARAYRNAMRELAR